MIDIHCHILPAFDDGAADLADAVAMARMAVDSGMTELVATPHFRGEERSLESIEVLYRRFRGLEMALRREKIPLKLHPGAEILCLPETIDLAQAGKLPTLGDTDHTLLEFFFDTPFSQMDMMLEEISRSAYLPVVAHPERYGAIQRDPRRVERWFRSGYVIQLNKGSVLGAFGAGVQRTALWLLDRGLAHLIASDAHSSRRRTTDMSGLEAFLRADYSGEYARILLEENPARLVRGMDMAPIDSF